ncbi:putative ribose-phosphate pyrophosphokinase [Trypanosoma grayi]|uniref:putative ribose-phosphate pyrophosphokinase n=1 Tax=Trypanosoma grayi TaxID=71804 RepID=UPI0004F458B6|nr:putative ribose-phosphate pyrophosphokinase [Trypanosoma grayi]KEG14199.1 putative ribose-phosphate pyrophosphokinase [Trypanosoma grayi]
MESTAYKLLRLVEAYATHPSHSVGKFIELPLRRGSFTTAFDANQLLEYVSCTASDEMELLCDVLRVCTQIHERSVGSVCRVNFITYVVLHAYYALAREATAREKNNRNADHLVHVEVEQSLSYPCGEATEEKCDTRCCLNIMKSFVRELRLKGHPVDPAEVLAEVSASTAMEEVDDIKRDNNAFHLSHQVLHEYLQRTFAYDHLSWGYNAGKLAVDCFLYIYPLLVASTAAEEMGTIAGCRRTSSLHTLTEQLLCKMPGSNDEWFSTRGGQGCMVPGVALMTTIRLGRRTGVLSGACVLAPLTAVEGLLQRESYYINLLFLFSDFPERVTEEEGSGFHQLVVLVEGVSEGLVVIVVRSHVSEEVLRFVETLGNNKRTILLVAAVGQTTMTRLSLTFRVLPRALEKLHLVPVRGTLRMKSLRTHDAGRCRDGVELRSFLVALEPLHGETKTKKTGIMQSIASVVFGGRCAHESVLVERLFNLQLHHLVNVFCLPTPNNAMMPAGGMAEAYAVSFLNHQISETSSVDGFSSRDFETRLMEVLRNAIVAYMESVLLKSGGLTVEEAEDHLATSQQRFGMVQWGAGSRSSRSGDNGATAPEGQSHRNIMYNNAVPVPPLINISEIMWAANRGAKSTLLLADVKEWEAQMEVASAYLCIGRCLDRLCFTSVLGKRAAAIGSEGGGAADELFFFPDIT